MFEESASLKKKKNIRMQRKVQIGVQFARSFKSLLKVLTW